MVTKNIQITLVYSPAPRKVWQAELTLPLGSTVGQAIATGDLFKYFPSFDFGYASVGIWGRKANSKMLLRDGDRIEIYRALRVDPKVARRERFSKQGARTAGLFARRRPGAKAGY